MQKDRFEMSRLLSGTPQLTVQEKEAVLEQVLRHTKNENAAASRSRFGLSSVRFRVAAAVLSVLSAVPVLYWAIGSGEPGSEGSGAPGTESEFFTRGAEASAYFSVKCPASEKSSVCRRGDTLTFQVAPSAENRYFAAFARHLGDDLVIWYFPEAGRASTRPSADGARKGLLAKGIQIGEDHPGGAYEIYGVFSNRPMTRDNIKTLFGDHFELKPAADAVVSKLSIAVEP